MRKIYFYNPETKVAVFKICEKGKVYIGKSSPAKEDFKIANKLTGLTIAEYKAKINREYSKAEKNRKQIVELNKQKQIIENQLKECNINKEYHTTKCEKIKKELKTYIKRKEIFYNRYKRLQNKNKKKEV